MQEVLYSFYTRISFIKNAELAKAIWAIWLGESSVAYSAALVDRLWRIYEPRRVTVHILETILACKTICAAVVHTMSSDYSLKYLSGHHAYENR